MCRPRPSPGYLIEYSHHQTAQPYLTHRRIQQAFAAAGHSAVKGQAYADRPHQGFPRGCSPCCLPTLSASRVTVALAPVLDPLAAIRGLSARPDTIGSEVPTMGYATATRTYLLRPIACSKRTVAQRVALSIGAQVTAKTL